MTWKYLHHYFDFDLGSFGFREFCLSFFIYLLLNFLPVCLRAFQPIHGEFNSVLILFEYSNKQPDKD
jgi:hypothetical protein